ncbi:hypothetical protein GSK94_12235 [Staphylococcus haemolyticus]|uniref:hypothetical protein n=1 Tax=Staphylococcus TaxID=1279 RepID=UPI00143F8A40|nr:MULTISPECIES: hypothetical protein [Staphylococcus]MEB6611128.1 hypothetical protein [Staphylococcus borealis]NKN68103.1 hypothetical protein [Staphylococcus haemolyticus]
MKNILLLVTSLLGTYYYLKYKEIKKMYLYELIDIESKEDLLEQRGQVEEGEIPYT